MLEQVSRMLEQSSKNNVQVPQKWWLYTIRTSLWMTVDSAAKRAWVTRLSWINAEKREVLWTITVGNLKKFLKALSFDLSYIPHSENTLKTIFEKEALRFATKTIGNIDIHMSLEKQSPWKKFKEKLIKQKVDDIIRSDNWKEIWL